MGRQNSRGATDDATEEQIARIEVRVNAGQHPFDAAREVADSHRHARELVELLAEGADR